MQSRLGDAVSFWVRLVIEYRGWVVLTVSALTLTSLYYAVNNLKIDTDLADMISPELHFRQTYEQYKHQFPDYVDTLVIVIEADTPELARKTAGRLLTQLKGMQGQFKSVFLPGGGEFFDRQAFLYMDLPELEDQADSLAAMQPFMGKLTQDMSLRGLLSMLGSALEAVQEGEILDLAAVLLNVNKAVEANLSGEDYRVSWQELMMGDQIEQDQRRQFIVVQPNLDFSALLAANRAVQTVRTLIQNSVADSGQGLHIRLTGSVALEYEELESVSKGAGMAALAALVMVLLILSIGLRSARLVFAVIITLLAGLVVTAGFATLAVGALNLISVAFAVLYIGLGVDFGIHLSLRYQELVAQGRAEQTALIDTAGGVGSSLVLCAVTTAVGFYAFVPTTYSGVSELGLISGTGMFISLVLSLTLLPALIDILKASGHARSSDREAGTVRNKFAELPSRHGRAVILGALLVTGLALLILTQIRFDYNPINLRDPDSESVKTFKDLVASSETPPWSASVLVSDVAVIEEIQSRLLELDSVSKAVAVTDFVPQDQPDKLDIIQDMSLFLGPELTPGDQAAPPILDAQLEAVQTFIVILGEYLSAASGLPWSESVQALHHNLTRLLDAVAESEAESVEPRIAELQKSLLLYLPNSLRLLQVALLASEFSLQDLPEDLARRWMSGEGYYRVAVFPKEDISENSSLRRFVNDIRTVDPDATGDPVISLESANVVVSAFQQAFAGALIVITLILVLILRKVTEVLLVLLPLLFAGLVTAALFVVTGSAFNFANIIALPLLLGMGVDNGIHMVSRARESGSGTRLNLLKTSTSRAVLFSALTTIVSFGNLSFSSHPGTASMGKILTIGVLVTLLSTLILLPAMLNRWGMSRSVDR